MDCKHSVDCTGRVLTVTPASMVRTASQNGAAPGPTPKEALRAEATTHPEDPFGAETALHHEFLRLGELVLPPQHLFDGARDDDMGPAFPTGDGGELEGDVGGVTEDGQTG